MQRFASRTLRALARRHGFGNLPTRPRNGAKSPYLFAEDVDGMVAEVLAPVRAKRDQLESFGGGTA